MTAAVEPVRPLADTPPIDLDTMTLDSFAGRPVAVLGLARSGVALARFLVDRGARMTVYDGRPAAELARSIEALGDRRVRLLLGPEVAPDEALRDQALVCTSPSVSSRYPTTEPRLREALGRLEAEGRVPVVSEIDLFLRLCPSTTIGVTGTKGKTTTSSFIAAVLAAGPDPVILGGNIGTPLVERLPELTARHRVVLELSELQLPTMSRGTDVAVYTHVTADHLDRHGSLEAYRAAKRRLVELLPDDGTLVLNGEDPVTAPYAELRPAGAALVRYRRQPPERGEIGVADGWIVADTERFSGPIMPIAELLIPGEHNLSNAAAAAAVGLLFGIAPDAIRAAMAGFRGVEHRLETVATLDGVRFVNDSMGTQPDAVIAALRSFAPPIVLIAGGRAKDLPIDELAGVVAARAAAAVFIGESGPRLEEAFRRAGMRHTEFAADLPAAVTRADAIAHELLGGGAPSPATVLMSPAAASFDMFEDYAVRGRVFKTAVAALAAARASVAAAGKRSPTDAGTAPDGRRPERP